MGFNKGEWSEVYVFLNLICNKKLIIVDSDLKIITKDIFEILELILNKYRYKTIGNKICKFKLKDQVSEFEIDDIKNNLHTLLESLISHKSLNGSFEIPKLDFFLNKMFDSIKIKGKSKTKIDLVANILDNNLNRETLLSYSIKSNLGNNPTLLNSSNHTNFIYEVTNINDFIMNECNNISTKRKLIDRYRYLIAKKAKINFINTQSDIFEHNLKMIDSNLSQIIANMLLVSYEKNQKNIDELLTCIISDKQSELFYKKKISDFVNAISFGMRAGETWNGLNEVNGGLLVVTKEGEVYLLDLIYFKSEVEKYLIENIKLDSPSSTRYKMFEIYKHDNRYFFKLNLQIRFK